MSFSCDYCDEKFTSQAALVEHNTSFASFVNQQCVVCGAKSFPWKSACVQKLFEKSFDSSQKFICLECNHLNHKPNYTCLHDFVLKQ